MKKKILIVDDSITIRINVRNMLGEEDFDIVEAENGAARIEL